MGATVILHFTSLRLCQLVLLPHEKKDRDLNLHCPHCHSLERFLHLCFSAFPTRVLEEEVCPASENIPLSQTSEGLVT